MKLNDRQKGFMILFLVFAFGAICKELGEFIIQGETKIETSSCFMVIGAGIGAIIGINYSKNK
jgi:hypothetical protein